MIDYDLQDDIAVIALDDGKANAVGYELIDGVNQSFFVIGYFEGIYLASVHLGSVSCQTTGSQQQANC